jgi:uncharacterized membrane protein
MRFNIQNTSLREAMFLVLKGIAMGAANKVPGVSGGIVALVGGFYEELIFSFQHLNFKAFKLFLNGRFKSFWTYINGSFLSLLFGGVIISFFSVSILLDYALQNNESIVLGAFFGMIVASLYLVIKQVKEWKKTLIIVLFLGFIFGLGISFTKPVAENSNLIFVFFCGIISVSGMTIPGLSGSFLLLILGNYKLLLVDSVNALFTVISGSLLMNFQSLRDGNIQQLLIILGIFTLGSLFGLILFSNLIKWVINKYPQLTLAAIIGFIAGTLRLVWPWKTKIYYYSNNEAFLKNNIGNPELAFYEYNIPDFSKFDTYTILIALILGVIILLVLNCYGNKRERKKVRTSR